MKRVAVAFDVDHTLAIDNKLERVAFLRLLARVVDEGGAPLGTLADETVHVDALLARQRAGACSIDEAVRAFVSERGAPADETYVRLYRAMALEMVEQFVVPLPYAPQTIEALRERGCLTGGLTNGGNPLQERKARRAGFPGPVLASADLGVQKPDGRAFEALAAVLGVPAESVWYVGDDPRIDVAGSRAAGMHAVWLAAEGTPYPAGLDPPEYVAGSLPEILAFLPETAAT